MVVWVTLVMLMIHSYSQSVVQGQLSTVVFSLPGRK